MTPAIPTKSASGRARLRAKKNVRRFPLDPKPSRKAKPKRSGK